MRPSITAIGLILILALSSGCQHEAQADLTPLPTIAAPPYVCEYIPLKAVELMTGVHDPAARGDFDLAEDGRSGYGSCVVLAERDDEQEAVLRIGMFGEESRKYVESQIKNGALPMPEIAPGIIGYYFKDPYGTDNAATGLLLLGQANIVIELETGVKGRDNAADVLALAKLIAPKLFSGVSAPSAAPSLRATSPKTPSVTKD